MPRIALRTWAAPVTIGAFVLMAETGCWLWFSCRNEMPCRDCTRPQPWRGEQVLSTLNKTTPAAIGQGVALKRPGSV